MLENIVNSVKANKVAVMEKAAIVAGAIVGLVVVGVALALRGEEVEDSMEDISGTLDAISE